MKKKLFLDEITIKKIPAKAYALTIRKNELPAYIFIEKLPHRTIQFIIVKVQEHH